MSKFDAGFDTGSTFNLGRVPQPLLPSSATELIHTDLVENKTAPERSQEIVQADSIHNLKAPGGAFPFDREDVSFSNLNLVSLAELEETVAYSMKGMKDYAKGLYPSAIAYFRKADEMDHDKHIKYNLGSALLAAGNPIEEAKPYFDEALRLARGDSDYAELEARIKAKLA